MLFVLNSARSAVGRELCPVVGAAPQSGSRRDDHQSGGNVTVSAGQSVSFSGSGSDLTGRSAPYAWTFPGGNPGSSALATPGNVTYSPRDLRRFIQVTDNGGLISPPATRTITVPDFHFLQHRLHDRSCQRKRWLHGDSGRWNRIHRNGRLQRRRSAVRDDRPRSIRHRSPHQGSTILTVVTAAATPAGSYPLTIIGTSGAVVHSAIVTLVVSVAGDFSISVTPASRTVGRGGSTTYAVTVAATPGFSGTVNLSVGGVPKFVTAIFSPASVVQSGTSVLTVTPKKQTKTGNLTMSITGTSGSLVHSTNITLIVQ